VKVTAQSRRAFLQLTATLAAGALPRPSSGAVEATRGARRIRAIAFDAFPIFDPRPIGTLAERLFPAQGAELMNTWRTRQFEYTWLRTLSKRYRDFWWVSEESLRFAARALKLDLTPDKQSRLMGAYLELRAWPDVLPALQALQGAGIRMRLLSNFTRRMLDNAVKSSALEGYFEGHLSADDVSAYKPAPRAYQMGIDAFQLPREQIAFAASAGWDAAGASWFGYPTIWINRLRAPEEELGVPIEAEGESLSDLLPFVSPPVPRH
jgi:2-haloacid dehalogenase